MDINLRKTAVRMVMTFTVVLLFLAAIASGVALGRLNMSTAAKSNTKTVENSGETSKTVENSGMTSHTSAGMLAPIVNTSRGEANTIASATSRGGVVVEVTSGRVLVGENMSAKCYPASTTKVLTALIVLDNLPLDKKIAIPKEAVGIEGSSIYLTEGEILTVEELLYGLMLQSGNDAAVALALATSGSIDGFAKLMNETAAKCGATSSNFVNPNGLHDDNHYTTPIDLALITAKAYQNADFCKIVSTKSKKIGGKDGGRLIMNKNKLLGFMDGANGVKTGYTKKSGRCLVGGAKRDGMQIVSVVLNYNDMWNDTMRMLNNAFANFEMCPLEKAMIYDGFEPRINAKTIEIAAEYDTDGNFVPYAYPLRKSGGESIVIT